mgnify:CR=1 FL=1
MIKAQYKVGEDTVAWIKFDENEDYTTKIRAEAPAKWDECVWDKGSVKNEATSLKETKKKVKNKTVSKKMEEDLEAMMIVDTVEDNDVFDTDKY